MLLFVLLNLCNKISMLGILDVTHQQTAVIKDVQHTRKQKQKVNFLFGSAVIEKDLSQILNEGAQ